eukprot:TRINITY_DN7239_c0_g1_i1.p1 TRINITY_DN7239_c0_g1~~TRINITY_DN7239_c0_g1_i1.p1  ORF type:complete len:107 (-),score=7.17 TRINITY_DN7239_c0_g1_i1:240-560(-)
MRRKPDLSKLNYHLKDPNVFLDGAKADSAEKQNDTGNQTLTSDVNINTVDVSNKIAKQPKEQKAYRLPLDLIIALRREAYERTMRSGYRVTETELVEEALKSYLGI